MGAGRGRRMGEGFVQGRKAEGREWKGRDEEEGKGVWVWGADVDEVDA